MNKRKLIVVVAAILMIALLGVIGYQNLVGEADGTITKNTAKPNTQATVSQRITIDGKYATFSYPTKFVTTTSEAVASPVLERYNFIKRQGNSWQIAIQVMRLDDGSLNDDGNYNYRNMTPGRFTREERQIGANQAIIFSDKTSAVFSKVGFLHHKNLSASISITGGATTNIDQVQTDFDALIASWQWR